MNKILDVQIKVDNGFFDSSRTQNFSLNNFCLRHKLEDKNTNKIKFVIILNLDFIVVNNATISLRLIYLIN